MELHLAELGLAAQVVLDGLRITGQQAHVRLDRLQALLHRALGAWRRMRLEVGRHFTQTLLGGEVLG